ncbi:MAG: site-specific integrase [Pseudomonadales bacterium]|nr:site-specific integrase [Pseudomonadales bacterium]
MKGKLTNKSVAALKPESRIYKVWDNELSGFFVRVMPSGTKTYAIHYRHNGQGRDHTLGRHGAITPTIARKMAVAKLGEVARGVDVQAERKQHSRIAKKAKYDTLGGFIEHRYAEWVTTERKSGKETLETLERDFEHLFGRKLEKITNWDVTKWRTDRLKGTTGKPLKESSINRRVSALKAVLSKAVEWEIIDANPIQQIKPLRTSEDKRVRYLTESEELRLREALDKRQSGIKSERVSANLWRGERNIVLLPDLEKRSFVDYLKPLCILAMNTGMRRGEIFQLEWGSVDFNLKQIKIKAASAKSGKSRDIPMNDEVLQTLLTWRNETDSESLVFPSPVTGKVLNNIKKSWKGLMLLSGIKEFRFHDLRHHFASRLVMAGVDLNTVRELLGHSSIDMTLRYAHLAPEHKAAAVALINREESWSR